MINLDTINNDLKQAMKDKYTKEVSVLLILVVSIKNKRIELMHELSSDEIALVVSSQIKQRNDAIEQFIKGNRQELADNEKAEIAILQKYLPQQLSEDEIKKIVSDAIAKTQAQNPSDIGKVMGILMPQIKGKADGKFVSDLVKKALNQ